MRKQKRMQTVNRERAKKFKTPNRVSQRRPRAFPESPAPKVVPEMTSQRSRKRLRRQSGSSGVPFPPTPRSLQGRHRPEPGRLWRRRYSGNLDTVLYRSTYTILIFRERSAKNLGKGLATPTSKTTKTTRTIKTAAPKRSILKTPGREPSKMRNTSLVYLMSCV